MTPDRRRFLAATLAVGSAAVAGCVGDDGGGDDDGDETEEEIHPDLRLDGTALSSTFPVELVEVGSNDQVVVIHWHGDNRHWHRQPLELAPDSSRSFRVIAVDRDRAEIPLGEGETYQLGISRGEETPADLVDVEIVDDIVTIHAGSAGDGLLFVELHHDGERAFLSPPLRTVVG